MISLRTFVNTSLCWIFVLVGFWAYTRWIDNTPAKQLLHDIGWDQLGNLTITTNETLTVNDEQSLISKLNAMESMIQATNMSCAMMHLHQQPQINLQVPETPKTTVQTESTYGQVMVPVFDTIANSKLAESDQFGPSSLKAVPVSLTKPQPTIADIITLVLNQKLTDQQKSEGLVNIFDTISIQLNTHEVQDQKLTLVFHKFGDLTPGYQKLVQLIFQTLFTQFSSISQVEVR